LKSTLFSRFDRAQPKSIYLHNARVSGLKKREGPVWVAKRLSHPAGIGHEVTVGISGAQSAING